MRVVLVVALAALLAGPAVSQVSERDKKRASLMGQMAYIFGGCEHHVPKGTADRIVSIITLDDGKEKTVQTRAFGQLYAEFYAKGRRNPEILALSDEQCGQILNDIADELNAVNRSQ